MEVELTEPEFAIYQKIHLYLARVYSQSFETGATAQGFIMVILQKLLTSSAPAMIKSLKKRITYLEQNQDAILKLVAETEDFREFCDDESTLDAFGGLEELDLEDRLVVQARKRQMMGEKKVSKMNLKDHIQILKEFVGDLQDLKKDSKVEQLLGLIHQTLSSNPTEKILIFTQFKETLYYIARLIEAKGYTASQFHGDLNEMQKNQAVMRFRHEVPIMLSTEIGGEGRNFQFCHIIVNYDLPWNPMRLEQRIGRLDRIGQTQNVQIYNFYIKNTIESSIITAIAERIHLFEESIGALEPILGNLERQITDLVLKDDEIPTKFRLDEVIAKTTNKIEEVYAKLDDIILDKRSFQYDYISNDLDRPDLLTGIDIFHFVRLFASISEEGQLPLVEIKRYNPQHEDAVWHLQIAEEYMHRLSVEKRRFSGVFDMDFARIEEEHDFFALGHPLIMGLTDFASSMGFGGLNAILYIDGAKWGSYFLSPFTARLPAAELEIFQKILRAQTGLCLFVFELEFLGCLVEKRVVPILITDEAEPLLTLAAFIGRPHNFSQIIVWDLNILAQIKKDTPKAVFTREILEQCYKQALQSTKILIRNRLEELSELNRTRYALEKANIMKLAEHKKKYAETQTKSLSQKLRVKKMKLPTEKQIENVEKLLDPAKKKRRLKEFDTIRNEVKYYESEIKRWENTLNDIEFDLPEQLKRLERYKQLLVNANFIGFARIRIV
jgi:hypothetical protein